MALAAPRPCLQPGCPSYAAARGRCTEHQRQDQKLYDSARGKTKARGYGGRWRKVRRRVLSREPLCRTCKEAGRVTPATDVDHIVPLKQGGAHYDPANLASLCKRCHNIKTASGL